MAAKAKKTKRGKKLAASKKLETKKTLAVVDYFLKLK